MSSVAALGRWTELAGYPLAGVEVVDARDSGGRAPRLGRASGRRRPRPAHRRGAPVASGSPASRVDRLWAVIPG